MNRPGKRIEKLRKTSQIFKKPSVTCEEEYGYMQPVIEKAKTTSKTSKLQSNKVILCAIAKLENNYIGEWVTHYKSLGVDKIVLFDNNSVNGENLLSVKEVEDGVNDGWIVVKDAKGKRKYQCDAYSMCYSEYSGDYGWFMFFDVDEFLILEKHKDVHDFLNQDKFQNFDSILVSWKVYNDNNLLCVSDGNYSVLTRFTTPSSNNGINKQSKCIIRGGLGKITFLNPHNPTAKLSCCDANGRRKILARARSTEVVHSGAWLNHYTTKTVQEFIECKIARGGGGNTGMARGTRDYFYSINKRTPEKDKYFDRAKK